MKILEDQHKYNSNIKNTSMPSSKHCETIREY